MIREAFYITYVCPFVGLLLLSLLKALSTLFVVLRLKVFSEYVMHSDILVFAKLFMQLLKVY